MMASGEDGEIREGDMETGDGAHEAKGMERWMPTRTRAKTGLRWDVAVVSGRRGWR